MFDHVGVIEFEGKVASEELMFETALEAGANEVESSAEIHIIITLPENFAAIRDVLIEKFGDQLLQKLDWKAKTTTDITNLESAQKLLKLIENLEDCDDVQSVTKTMFCRRNFRKVIIIH